jgi:hypothetical protein
MSVDLAQALQDFSSVVDFMRRNAQQLWDVYLNPNPQTVAIYGPDGQVVNSVPNLAKWRQIVWEDALSAMTKTIYINQRDGSDENDGTSSSPVRTINEAIKRIPAGGWGILNIQGDYKISEPILVEGKNLTIIPRGELRLGYRIHGDTYYQSTGFVLRNSNLLIVLDSDIEGRIFLEDIPNDKPSTPYNGFITVHENCNIGSGYIYLRIKKDDYTPIRIGQGQQLFSILEWSYNRPSFATFGIAGHYSGTNREVIINSNNAFIANLQYAPSGLYINYDPGFKDESGNAVDPAEKVTGLVKDSNGVPRNVISNLVL